MPEPLTFMMGNYKASVPADRRYGSNHMWLRADGDALQAGLTAYAVRLLQEIYFLDWAVDAGATVREQDEIGTIESSKAASGLYAPIGGTITRFNPVVLADPSVINDDNYGAGWLFEMTGDAAKTMQPQQYLESLAASWAKAQAMLKGQLA